MAFQIFTKYRSDYFHMSFGERWEKLDKAIDLVKEALEQPAQEPFIGGDCICPKCKNKSLYKTDKSEWCVTHKCLWQSDYPHQWKVITKQEIIQADNASNDLHAFARAIDQILKEKNSTISAFCKHGLPRGMCRLGEKDCD